jgi:hypothetical protein
MSVASEWSIVPGWARALAALPLVGAAVASTAMLAQSGAGDAPRVALFAGAAFAAAGFLALFLLLVGYVNVDARRRGMGAAVWTLVVILVPNGIGFVIYFLMREPRREPCPGCGHAVPSNWSYCPSCGTRVSPVCPQCGRGISPEHAHCPHCGRSLAAVEPSPSGT